MYRNERRRSGVWPGKNRGVNRKRRCHRAGGRRWKRRPCLQKLSTLKMHARENWIS